MGRDTVLVGHHRHVPAVGGRLVVVHVDVPEGEGHVRVLVLYVDDTDIALVVQVPDLHV